MPDKRAIGVFDSGLGGLTVVKEIIKLLPNEDIVYFGDTGRVPYGNRSRETIRKYARQDEAFLLGKNVKLIVAACGTVSSVAADTGKDLPVDFIEVVSHSAKAAVNVTKNGIIGIMGTAATVKSGAHKKQILEMLPGATVISSACPLLVPFVEEGWTDENDPMLIKAIKEYMRPITEAGADTVILGCTHYPILIDAIKKASGENLNLINMGEETAKAVKELLTKKDMLNKSGGRYDFFVSDKTDTFGKTAFTLLGKHIDENDLKTADVHNL